MADQQVATIVPFPIREIAFGIKFGPQWAVLDRLGVVADAVLDSEPFGPGVFPESHRQGTSFFLVNRRDDSLLTLNERDCILQMSTRSRNLEDLRTLAANYEQHIVAPMLKAGMRDVIRYGVMLRLEECSGVLGVKPIDHYLAQEGEVKDFDLRFTRRLPSEAARVKKNVNDFRNLIYMISQSEEGEVDFAFDYQELFEPPLDRSEIEAKSFARFVDDGLSFYSKNYKNWLDQFRRNAAA
jgi:hypothetical protein